MPALCRLLAPIPLLAAVIGAMLVFSGVAEAACDNSSTRSDASCYDPEGELSWWDYPSGSQGHTYMELKYYSGACACYRFWDDDSDTSIGTSGTVTAVVDGPCTVGQFNTQFRFYFRHRLKGPTWVYEDCDIDIKYRYCNC